MQKIIPHLWYDKEAREAAEFYMSLFKNSRIKNTTILNDTPSGTAELLTIELEGQEFMLISAGPFFKFTPAVSFLITCNSTKEAESLWDKFVENGTVLIPLETYNLSRKFGWVMDKYGLSWQIIYKDEMVTGQKITPVVTFDEEQCGKAEEAIQFYTSIFKHSKINNILRYSESDTVNRANTVENGEFILENQTFIAMDSPHDYDFTFNEAISFVVNCDTQEEIDYYWDKLSAYPEAEQCGWLKDRYGLSWQITPTIMNDMMNEKDDLRLANVTKAFLKMKKFDISELKKAYAKITIQTIKGELHHDEPGEII